MPRENVQDDIKKNFLMEFIHIYLPILVDNAFEALFWNIKGFFHHAYLFKIVSLLKTDVWKCSILVCHTSHAVRWFDANSHKLPLNLWCAETRESATQQRQHSALSALCKSSLARGATQIQFPIWPSERAKGSGSVDGRSDSSDRRTIIY